MKFTNQINKNFLFLLIGQFISVLGERISTLVFFSIAVSIIGSESSFLASLLLAIQFTPLFLFGYIFGMFADEFNQKKLMIFADIIRALLILLLIFNSDSLILLYLVVFSIGLFTAFFEPSKKSLIPFIVDKKNLINLNKIFALVEIFAIFLGILMGSVLLELVSVKQALTINLITYFISFLFILGISYTKKNILKNDINFNSIKSDFKSGFRYLKNNYNAKHVILNITLINFFAAGINFSSISDYTISNSNELDPGSQIGIFLLIMAFGALLSPIFSKFIDKFKLKDSSIIMNSFFFGGVSAVIISILLQLNKISYYNFLIFFFFSGILVGIIYSKILYLIHINTDEKYYGRVISINDLTSSSTTIFGIVLGGLIIEYTSYIIGFLLTGIIFIIGGIYFYIVKRKISW